MPRAAIYCNVIARGMEGEMGYTIAAAYILQSVLAWWLLMVLIRRFLKPDPVTNGDAILATIVAVTPVGLMIALVVCAADWFSDRWSKWAQRPFWKQNAPHD